MQCDLGSQRSNQLSQGSHATQPSLGLLLCLLKTFIFAPREPFHLIRADLLRNSRLRMLKMLNMNPKVASSLFPDAAIFIYRILELWDPFHQICADVLCRLPPRMPGCGKYESKNCLDVFILHSII